jgi:ubiquinone/menaquinone biosynthesis C-methylase UbiE
MDAGDYRIESRERWERAARGWGARRAEMQSSAAPVSQWMVEAIRPQPGQTVLELAAGPGDTGFLAAERIKPGGKLISTDTSEAMLEVARERAAELRLDNVEFKPMEAEWIDLSAASVDGVLCRWGYMLLADPGAALRETRRVLKPGGRVALAAWAAREANPWVSVVGEELMARGAMPPTDPSAPGMFAFSDPARVEELLDEAGFVEHEIDTVDFVFRAPSFDEWWEWQFDTSLSLVEASARLTPEQRDELHDAVEARLAEYVAPDGSIALPARSLVAWAEA